MYCSSCGKAVAHSLIYCNHCGAKLNGARSEADKASVIPPQSLVWAMVAIFVFGMAIIIALVSALKNPNFNVGLINALLLFSGLLMLSLEGIFAWLLLSRRKAGNTIRETPRLSEQTAKELYEAPARLITEPVPSAIEQTTNQLQPIYRDQKSK